MLTQDLAVITPDEAEERLVSPPPVLISEHEVGLATSIALRSHQPVRRRWADATHTLVATMHRTLTGPTRDDCKVRRDYPKHYAFMENASMAREMDHL
jgi:hypothetical protein